jgi:uncharacterized protein (TIGR03086 family)
MRSMIVDMAVEVGDLHLAVCRRFGGAVESADGRWDHRAPCDAWDARAVLEHVIGFHDALLLRPLGLKPDRPRDNPLQRWQLTFQRLAVGLELDSISGHVVRVPGIANNKTTETYVGKLLPRLTQDVLVHTWDLARAVGADDRLDAGWCAMFLEQLPPDPDALGKSGMFAPPVGIDEEADIQSRFLARLGRDPTWPGEQ